jgi:hypothetical protein
MIKPIGITGFARCGKDTFFDLFTKYCDKNNIKTKRIALADLLKNDLKDFVYQNFNLDIWNVDNKNKEFIRPLMLVYGKLRRDSTNGKYWTNKVQNQVDECITNGIIPVITDLRYDEFPEDEYFWLKQKNNGYLVSITLAKNKPANKEERVNITKIKRSADYKIRWKIQPDMDTLYSKYEKYFKEILKNATTK